MVAGDSSDARQVVIPVRHVTIKIGSDQVKAFRHKDSILVGLGLILFLSFTWIYFVHRMYLNIEPSTPAAASAGTTVTSG